LTEYSTYLQSEAWKKKRNEIMQRDNKQCRFCGQREALQVHHLTYKNLGNENEQELITLCKSCHKMLHDVMSIHEPKAKDALREYRAKAMAAILPIAAEYSEMVSSEIAEAVFELFRNKKMQRLSSVVSWARIMLTDYYEGCLRISPPGIGYEINKMALQKVSKLRKAKDL